MALLVIVPNWKQPNVSYLGVDKLSYLFKKELITDTCKMDLKCSISERNQTQKAAINSGI